MIYWVRYLVGVVLVLAAGVAAAAPQDIVVMVQARHARSSAAELGAGLVVAQTPARTVIVTARHVIVDESGDLATGIDVEFSQRRGRMYAASASLYYTDRDLDLAVLLVEHDRSGVPPTVLGANARKVLSATPPAQLRGAAVTLIGAMNRTRWARGPQGDTVVAVGLGRLQVRSVDASAGASGGGLFDRFSSLLAMASRIDSASGHLVAIPMTSVLTRLKRWGFETTLEPAALASDDDGLAAQMRPGLKVEVVYTEPEPAAPGGLWPGSPSNGFQHRITARLSPALRALSPVVRLEFVERPWQSPIELRAPEYTFEAIQPPVALDVQAVLVLPDQRRIGALPVKLDFASAPQMAARRLGYDQEVVARTRRSFDENERVNRKAHAVSSASQREHQEGLARQNLERARKGIVGSFPFMRLSCEKQQERWSCRPRGGILQSQYGAPFPELIHSLTIGAGARDLTVSLALDASVDLARLFAEEAALLLDDGARGVFVAMRLSDGQELGPRQMCQVYSVRGAQPVCN